MCERERKGERETAGQEAGRKGRNLTKDESPSRKTALFTVTIIMTKYNN